MKMTRAALAAAFLLAAAPAAAADDTCLAAAERVMAFMVAEVEATPGAVFAAGMETPEARAAALPMMAARFAERGVESCAVVLSLPDGAMQAIARAQFRRD